MWCQKAFREKKSVNSHEYCHTLPDGSTKWLEITSTPIKDEKGDVIAALELGLPITERKQAQEALKASEERLNLAQKVAHIGSWEWDIKSETPIWSEELCRILDINPQKASKALLKRVHPDDIKAFNNAPKCLKTKGDRASVDYRIILDDGSIRFLHSEQMVTEVDEAGKPSRIVGVEQDITERKKTEAALWESGTQARA
jgi:PAS domain S-box-containing protein